VASLLDDELIRAPTTPDEYLTMRGAGTRYGPIPTEAPDNTYRGNLPTPPSDYGSTLLNLPHDYQRQLELLRPSDPEAYRQLLKLIYMNRDNRRA
jgi:hypothetical protein